jgi:hypothetical protein
MCVGGDLTLVEGDDCDAGLEMILISSKSASAANLTRFRFGSSKAVFKSAGPVNALSESVTGDDEPAIF